MKKSLLNYLCCPICKNPLSLRGEIMDGGEVKEGILACVCQNEYKIINYIPRFVPNDKYVASFSFEWKKHSVTQLDSVSSLARSQETFSKRVDFALEDLKGRMVLDAGCGSGRFTEVAAKFGAIVVGFDLSYAIDVAFKNIGRKENVHLLQADIFHLPFKAEGLDFIYSFGVLHHTPDTRLAFAKLPPLLRKGGKISIFVYSAYNKTIVYSSDFWRFFTTKIPKRLLYYLCYLSVPLYYVYRLPLIGNILKMFLVISMEPHWKWRQLDTFDWYSPKYQFKHTHFEVFKWFEDAGLKDIKIFEGEVTMLGSKK